MPILGKLQRKLGTIKEVDALAEWADCIIDEATDLKSIPEASDAETKSFLITAKLAEGGEKTFRIKAQNESEARKKFAQHHNQATIVNIKKEVEEANIQPTSAKSRTHIGNLSDPIVRSVVHPSSGKEIGLITKQPDGKFHAHTSSTALAHAQDGNFDSEEEAHQFIRNAHAKAMKNNKLSDKWQKREKLPQFANNQDAASANESVNEEEMAPDCTCRPHQTDSNCPVHGHDADPDGWNTMGESYEGKDELARILQMVKHKR
jgi:hypothetical protein